MKAKLLLFVLFISALQIGVAYFDERLTPKYHFVSVWAMMDPNGL
jgi:hypothetical protein